MKYYILDGHRPVAVDSCSKDCMDFMAHPFRRRVAEDVVGGVRVSTVFLCVDHDFTGLGPPLLFETMVFGGPVDDYQARYSTWEDAERGHVVALARVMRAVRL